MKKEALDCASIYIYNFAANLFHATSRVMTQKCQQKQNDYFIPRISLLDLLCFVVEVRWLFPVIPQKYRESTKQRNTEPS